MKKRKKHNDAEFFYIKNLMTGPSLLPKVNFFDKSITTGLNYINYSTH